MQEEALHFPRMRETWGCGWRLEEFRPPGDRKSVPRMGWTAVARSGFPS